MVTLCEVTEFDERQNILRLVQTDYFLCENIAFRNYIILNGQPVTER